MASAILRAINSVLPHWAAVSEKKYSAVDKKDDDPKIEEAKQWVDLHPISKAIYGLSNHKKIQDFVKTLFKDLKKFPITFDNIEIVQNHLINVGSKNRRVINLIFEEALNLKIEKIFKDQLCLSLIHIRTEGSFIKCEEDLSAYESSISSAERGEKETKENKMEIENLKQKVLRLERAFKAAEQGSVAAQSNFYFLNDQGRDVEKFGLAQASVECLKAAEQGNVNAQRHLAAMYLTGEGIEKSEVKAVEWYKKAAEQGDAKAQKYMGVMYVNGHGVEKSEVKAGEWFKKAAEQGDAEAQRYMGVMYVNGHGVEKSKVDAVKWFKKAAEQGDAEAQLCLGALYANGQGVEKSEVEAAHAAVYNQAQGELTLKAMMRESGRIHELVKAKDFDLERAQAITQALYQAGIQLIPGEISYQPIIRESVLPIAIELSTILAEPLIQHAPPLLRSLSRVYLLFVELTWIQGWRMKCTNDEVFSVSSSLKDDLTLVALEAIKPLPKKSIIDVKFRLRSAQEAIKCLQGTESVWTKYAEGAASLSAAAVNLKFRDLLKGLQTLYSNVKNDQPARWYLDTYLARWKASNARTLKELVNGLSFEEIKKYEKEGGKYTVCLVLIFMEIFENFEADVELRKLAFEQVRNLFTLERESNIEEYQSRPLELFKAIAGMPDRYCSTRLLAMQFLKLIATKKDRYERFSELSSVALLTRAEVLKGKADKRYIEEKGFLKRKIDDVARNKKDLEDKVEDLNGHIADLAEESRSGSSKSLDEVFDELKEVESAIDMQQEELYKLAEFEELLSIEAELKR